MTIVKVEAKGAGRTSATTVEQLQAAAASRDALLRRQTVQAMTGLSCSSIYKLQSESRFPKAQKLSANCVRWRAGDVLDWLAARAA